MSSSRSASMMFILRNSWRCGTWLQHVTGLWDRRAAAAVQKSWPDDQQPPQKSLSGEPPPDEDQCEEWRLPPTIYQNKPAWCEEICEKIYRIWTQWHLVDQHRSDPPLNPQDGSKFSPLHPVESNHQRPTQTKSVPVLLVQSQIKRLKPV